MFFDNLKDIPRIAQQISCSIFVVPSEIAKAPKLDLPHPLYLRPDEDKKTELISVEQLRDFLALTNSRETSDRFFVVAPADAMNEAAQNAFLKTFEEPKDYCHFILLTEQPNALLPTIRSRAQIFYLRQQNTLDQPPKAKDKTMALAKQLIAASARDLPTLAADLAKSKTQPRQQALEIVGLAIELLYKSYFKTGNSKFLTKLPNFLALYDHLNQNCHIKLHLVADLI